MSAPDSSTRALALRDQLVFRAERARAEAEEARGDGFPGRVSHALGRAEAYEDAIRQVQAWLDLPRGATVAAAAGTPIAERELGAPPAAAGPARPGLVIVNSAGQVVLAIGVDLVDLAARPAAQTAPEASPAGAGAAGAAPAPPAPLSGPETGPSVAGAGGKAGGKARGSA